MSEGLRIYNLFAGTLFPDRGAGGPDAGWTAALPHAAGMAFNAVRIDRRVAAAAPPGDASGWRDFTAAAADHGLRVIVDLEAAPDDTEPAAPPSKRGARPRKPGNGAAAGSGGVLPQAEDSAEQCVVVAKHYLR